DSLSILNPLGFLSRKPPPLQAGENVTKGRPTPKQKPAQKKKNTGSGYDAEYRRFREQFMRDVTDPKKIREADRLAFFSGTQIILEN
ncbi:hypothetical protein AAAX10_05185, partial [Bifidobacterium longum]